MSLHLWKFWKNSINYNREVWFYGKLWQALGFRGDLREMATNTANGNHQTTTKPPPLPSPLRFSKFFQVRNIFIFLLADFTFLQFRYRGYWLLYVLWHWYYNVFAILIFLHLLVLAAFVCWHLLLTAFLLSTTSYYFCSILTTVHDAFALTNSDLIYFSCIFGFCFQIGFTIFVVLLDLLNSFVSIYLHLFSYFSAAHNI